MLQYYLMNADERNPEEESRQIHTEGGAYFEGGIQTQGGDFVARDKINIDVAAGAQFILQQALNNAEQARAQEQFENEKIAQAVANYASSLQQLSQNVQLLVRNPYPYLLPFELADAWRFFGRQTDLKTLLDSFACADSRCRLCVLHGDSGIGKTSFLQAGLMPDLIRTQQLPLMIRTSSIPLDLAIKQRLLPDLNVVPVARQAYLRAYLLQVKSLLPSGCRIYLLLDQFENFFGSSPEVRRQFVQSLADCLSDETLPVHWLISIRSSWLGHLNSFQPDVPQPFSNTLVLPPLTRPQATEAIQAPAQATGLQMHADLLSSMLDDLGGDRIDPSRLQIVCHTLAALAPDHELMLTTYQQAGRVDGIIHDHIELILQRNFTPSENELVKTLLIEIASGEKPHLDDAVPQAGSRQPYSASERRRILGLLETNRLIYTTDEGYQIASSGLMASIKVWMDQRALLEQARVETSRQLDRIRDSALRGLLAGGLGFGLVYAVTFSNRFSGTLAGPLFLITTAQRVLPGALAGLLAMFFLDLATVISYGNRRWVSWLVAALGGGLGLGLAVLFHAMLFIIPQEGFGAILAKLLLALLQGLVWGSITSLLTLWVVKNQSAWKWVLPLAILGGGAAAWISNWLGKALGSQASWTQLAAGMILQSVWIFAGLWSGKKGGISYE